MDWVLWLEADGDRVRLGGGTDDEFAHVMGSSGFGMVETVARIREGAGSGGVHIASRVSTRKMVVQMAILGGTDALIAAGLVRVVGMLRGAPKWVVEYVDGETWELPFVYKSGLELEGGTADAWLEAPLSVECPQPFWVRRRVSSFEAAMFDGGAVAFLSDVSALPISESQLITDMVVSNSGVVEAPVSWVVSGPASGDTSIAVGGRWFTIKGPLAEGDTVFVDAARDGRPVVTDASGASRYDLLGPAPKFPKLPPGDTLVELSMVGAVASTRVSTGQVEVENLSVNPKFANDLAGTDFEGDWDWSSSGAEFTGPGTGGLWQELVPPPGATKFSAGFEALGDGAHAFVSFWAGDLPLSHAVAFGDLVLAGLEIPDGCDRILAGVGFDGDAGHYSRNIFTNTPMSVAFFDGDTSVWTDWTGDPDESTSVRYVTELTGGSSIVGSFQPRKEVVY